MMSKITFEEWCDSLNKEGRKLGCPYDMVEATGAEAWRDMYDDGYTPRAAIMEDWKNA